MRPWREAWEAALYGPGGFWTHAAPADHFRTSVHASPLFAQAVARLLHRVDAALGHPDPLDLVDVGAGRGELLDGVAAAAGLGSRLRLTAVEVGPLSALRDVAELPPVTGLLVANEWLDDVPLDVVELTPDGPRLVLVADDGTEALGPAPAAADTAWLTRWWPPADPDPGPDPAEPGHPVGTGEGRADGAPTDPPHQAAVPGHPVGTGEGRADGAPTDPGHRLREDPDGGGGGEGGRGGERAEVGWTRDEAWAAAVGRIERGVAVAIDYGHEAAERPRAGTLAGYRAGARVPPVPDGSCNLTAHVALDSVAAAGRAAGAGDTRLDDQRSALMSLGVDPRRPPLTLARTDPAAYVEALRSAGEAAELTDRAGLGGFRWLVQGVGIRVPFPPAATRARVRRAPAPRPPGS